MRNSSIKKPATLLFAFVSLCAIVAFSLVLADGPDTSPVGPTPTPGHVWSAEADLFTPRTINDVLDIASDTCANAQSLVLGYDGFIVAAVGDQTRQMGSFTTAFALPADPALTCLAGSARPQGYRSAWYKVTAPVGGTMTVKTVTDQDYKRNYDTVVAVFKDSSAGDCLAMQQLACNDDYDAFLSQTSFQAEQGETYHIEIVDRNIAASGPIHLNIEVSMEPNVGWENEGTGMPHRLSRHAVVMDGPDAYIIAGQNDLVPDVKRLGQVWRYETDTGRWVQLADMPANEAADGRGYSATDAVKVGNKIHMVSGYVGSIDSYAGDHWVYDIPSNSWSIQASPTLNWNADGLQGPVGYSQLSPYSSGNQTGFILTGGLAGRPLSDDPTQVLASAEVRRYVETGAIKSWVAEPDMQVARYGHTAATIGGAVCVAGGLTNNGSNQIVDLVECYDRFGAASWFTIEPMNTSRFYAGSTVGPDGVWYVYGGRDQNQQYVETIEAIDITVPGAQWEVLDVNFDIDNPPYAWLRGGFVANRLYLFGGDIPNDLPTGVVQSHDFSSVRLSRPPVSMTVTSQVFLPMAGNMPPLPASAPTAAKEIFPGNHYHDNYSGPGDAYNIYQYNPKSPQRVQFDLVSPFPADYDLLLYDGNKNLIQIGNNLGAQGEWIKGTYPPGRYYLIVARVDPPPSLPPVSQNYELRFNFE